MFSSMCPWKQKDLLGRELQMVVCHRVGAGRGTWSFARAPGISSPPSHLSSPIMNVLNINVQQPEMAVAVMTAERLCGSRAQDPEGELASQELSWVFVHVITDIIDVESHTIFL